ncbi:hypothetical protein M7I_5955 [Glarea lozoyensis 74030]|uniref:Uncharacterized protein n=1 Tax=Glarea lozoyensis (strain ATCC 74030 / MF5533) TaxID=1104152 RepID=H0ET96_GLAL7|nr:hypothetical protein M7I_5955 [Glarea lozoyensis 74030]
METHEDDHPQADPEDAVDLTHVTFIYRLFTISWGITFFLILTLYPIILLIEHFSTSSFAHAAVWVGVDSGVAVEGGG